MVAKLVNGDLVGTWCWKVVALPAQLFKFTFCALAKTNWFGINKWGCWWPKLMKGFGGMRGALDCWTAAIWASRFSWNSPTTGVCCIPSGSDLKICRGGGGGGIRLGCCWWFISDEPLCGLSSIRGFINGCKGMPFTWLPFIGEVRFVCLALWLNLGIVLLFENFAALCCCRVDEKNFAMFSMRNNFDSARNLRKISWIPPRSTHHRLCAACNEGKVMQKIFH